MVLIATKHYFVMRKSKIYIFILIFAVSMSFFSSCIKKPVFSGVENLKFNEQSETSIKANLDIKLRNDNMFKIKADKLTYNIYIKENLVGKGKTISKVLLPANTTTNVTNNIEFMLEGVSNVFEYISQVDSVPIDFAISGRFTRFNIPLNHKFTHYVNKEEFISKMFNKESFSDSYKIKHVKFVSGSLSSSQLKISVEFTNRFPLSFTVDSLSFDIYPKKGETTKIGAWRTGKPYVIPAEGSVLIDAEVSLSNLNVVSSLFSKIFDSDKSFFMEGNAYIKVANKNIQLPIEKKLNVNM